MQIDHEVVLFAKALADDTRQEIMKLLCCQWLSVNDVVDAWTDGANQPTASHHLKLLTDAGLVHLRQEGATALLFTESGTVHDLLWSIDA